MTTLISLGLMLNLQIAITSEPWQPINDGVMGGVSSGRMVNADDLLRFEGMISLENNGGFASARRRVDRDFSAATRVLLEVRGDGRQYQFRLRLDDNWDGITWRAAFLTTGQWQRLELPLTEFEPVFRGRRVSGRGTLEAAQIRQIGFMLADKQAGPFKLEIRSIEFR